jgi:phosphopantothenoylcysteine decarboxylase/phosphopantothenate--cysteine ligase
MSHPLANKHLVLGITGSIAAYKAAELASKLTQAGARVDVILTRAAEAFVTPLTFQSVTGRKAYSDDDLWGGQAHVLHVGMGHSADMLIIAPCSANTLAKLAHGIADNLLSVTALSAGGRVERPCPIVIAPAMDVGMYGHPATQANVAALRARGVTFIGPVEGRMASGLSGLGRFVEPVEIFGHIRQILAQNGPLAGRKVVVTAGGTQEPIDPVRVVANRSSGKQGFALAQAALDLGAAVTLIAGPVALPTPVGARRLDVQTAAEMLAAVLAETAAADALLMAAAVADFRPAAPAEQKIKKEAGVPTIELAANPDILLEVARRKAQTGLPLVTVGFAAESQALLENARHKLAAKKLDLIVANDISAADAGFAVDTNRVTLLDMEGAETLPLMGKDAVAEAVLARVVTLFEGLKLKVV